MNILATINSFNRTQNSSINYNRSFGNNGMYDRYGAYAGQIQQMASLLICVILFSIVCMIVRSILLCMLFQKLGGNGYVMLIPFAGRYFRYKYTFEKIRSKNMTDATLKVTTILTFIISYMPLYHKSELLRYKFNFLDLMMYGFLGKGFTDKKAVYILGAFFPTFLLIYLYVQACKGEIEL